MIFSPDKMWQAAVKQMGAYSVGPNDFPSIILDTPEDVAELYKALQEAHWEAVTRKEALLNVADYERKL